MLGLGEESRSAVCRCPRRRVRRGRRGATCGPGTPPDPAPARKAFVPALPCRHGACRRAPGRPTGQCGVGPAAGSASRGLCGLLHGHPGRDRHQRRRPGGGTGTVRLAHRDPVDHRRLHPGLRRSAAHRRRAGGPAGQPPDLLHRRGGLHARLGRLRPGPGQRGPDRRPAGGRTGRGPDRARLARPPATGVSGTRRALPGLRPVGLHGGHRGLRRAPAGRPPGHHRGLALGVLHQPARGMRLPAADAASCLRFGPAYGPPRGLAGPVRAHRHRRPAHHRPQRGRTTGLDGPADPHRSRPVSAVGRRVRAWPSARPRI